MRVLVTGGGGYIGSRLVGALLADGHEVRASFTDPTRAPQFWWYDRVEVVRLDVRQPDQVAAAVAGVDAAYYLVHSMSGPDFIRADRTAAHHMATAAAAAGVQRLIYLSGLVPPVAADQLSDHLSSRAEVERILTASSVPTTTVRCAIILGSGSTSFEILRQISHRLLVHPISSWMGSLVQPVAVVDVLAVLVACLTVDPAPRRSYDVGGPERLSYADLLARFCAVAGLPRARVPLLGVDESIAGTLAGLLTDVPSDLVRELVHSLRHDMVCGETDFRTDLLAPGTGMVGLDAAIGRALAAPRLDVPAAQRDPMAALPGDPAWASRAWTWAQQVDRLRGDALGEARRAAQRAGDDLTDLTTPAGLAAAAAWAPRRMLAWTAATTARLRGGRALHHLGIAGTGVLRLHGGATGVPVLDDPAELPVRVRWSRGLGVSWQGVDIEGLAVRLPLGADNRGRRPFADLLFASTGTGDLGRYAVQPRPAGEYGPLTTLIPVRTASGQLILRLTPTAESAAPLRPPASYALSWSGLQGAWRPLGDLDISWSDGDTDERYDAVSHPLPGAEPHPLITVLRRSAYRSSRDRTPRV